MNLCTLGIHWALGEAGAVWSPGKTSGAKHFHTAERKARLAPTDPRPAAGDLAGSQVAEGERGDYRLGGSGTTVLHLPHPV